MFYTKYFIYLCLKSTYKQVLDVLRIRNCRIFSEFYEIMLLKTNCLFLQERHQWHLKLHRISDFFYPCCNLSSALTIVILETRPVRGQRQIPRVMGRDVDFFTTINYWL